MDCDINLEMIDKYLLQRCETAEYCVTNIIDDTSEEWGRPWDWVFMTTTWDNLDTETGNWEDWN